MMQVTSALACYSLEPDDHIDPQQFPMHQFEEKTDRLRTCRILSVSPDKDKHPEETQRAIHGDATIGRTID